MPMPATPKKSPIKAFVRLTPRQPISANESVVRVVENAPIAKAVWCISALKFTPRDRTYRPSAHTHRTSKLSLDGDGHRNVIRLGHHRAIGNRRSRRWAGCNLARCQSLVEVAIRLDVVEPFQLLYPVLVAHLGSDEVDTTDEKTALRNKRDRVQLEHRDSVSSRPRRNTENVRSIMHGQAGLYVE